VLIAIPISVTNAVPATALAASAGRVDAAARTISAGLVGLRRNLFPAAPPFDLEAHA